MAAARQVCFVYPPRKKRVKNKIIVLKNPISKELINFIVIWG